MLHIRKFEQHRLGLFSLYLACPQTLGFMKGLLVRAQIEGASHNFKLGIICVVSFSFSAFALFGHVGVSQNSGTSHILDSLLVFR